MDYNSNLHCCIPSSHCVCCLVIFFVFCPFKYHGMLLQDFQQSFSLRILPLAPLESWHPPVVNPTEKPRYYELCTTEGYPMNEFGIIVITFVLGQDKKVNQ